jgi:hypothetical protein
MQLCQLESSFELNDEISLVYFFKTSKNQSN